MDVIIDQTKFKDIKIMVATPMNTGTAHFEYIKSLLEFQNQTLALGIKIEYQALTTCSIIQHARNILANNFLNSDCTHLFFLDSDVGFDTSAVLYMLSQDKEIIGGSYPRKKIKWENIRTAILNHPDISVEDLIKVGSAVPILPLETNDGLSLTEPVKIAGLPTGLMMIKREVFEQLIDIIPDESYPPENDVVPNTKYPRIHQFFKVTTIVENGVPAFYGEDFFFSKICMDAGFDLWLAPWVEGTHTGSYTFRGSLGHISYYADSAVN